MLDDTCYFLPLASRGDADTVASLLHSDLAQGCLRSRIFWDAKRPITAGLLCSLNLAAVADRLGVTLPSADR